MTYFHIFCLLGRKIGVNLSSVIFNGKAGVKFFTKAHPSFDISLYSHPLAFRRINNLTGSLSATCKAG
jgi:hypothetical protein